MKEKIKSLSFWAGIIGSIFLMLGAFGVEIGDDTANAVINAVCSLLVVLGIAAPPESMTDESVTGDDDTSETNE